jgi:hypothetical protein
VGVDGLLPLGQCLLVDNDTQMSFFSQFQ